MNAHSRFKLVDASTLRAHEVEQLLLDFADVSVLLLPQLRISAFEKENGVGPRVSSADAASQLELGIEPKKERDMASTFSSRSAPFSVLPLAEGA